MRSLFKEQYVRKMNSYDSPDGDLIKEVYARFGLAYYLSECLNSGLVTLAALLDFGEPRYMTRPRLEEKLSYSSSLTLGKLILKLETKVSQDLFEKLRGANEKRRYLAHRFWFEQVNLMTTVKGIGEMIAMLEEMQDYFEKVDSEVQDLCVEKLHEIGVTDEDLQESFEKVLRNEDTKKFLSQRKLRRQERLVRVWQIGMAEDSQVLIFETQDGCLWQLCDVGLGWTYFERPESHWQENQRIARYLPANTNPRPDDAQPWSYDLRLGNKAAILVRPGSVARRYQWSLRELPIKRN